jgi:hypothetical protein
MQTSYFWLFLKSHPLASRSFTACATERRTSARLKTLGVTISCNEKSFAYRNQSRSKHMAFTASTGFFENPGKPLAIIPEHLLEDTAQRFSFESHLNEIVKDAVEWMVSSKKIKSSKNLHSFQILI